MEDASQVNVYKVKMFVRGTEDDAQALRKILAQTVFDGFEMSEKNAVFGVNVEITIAPAHEYVMALYMVELDDGLDAKQIERLLSELPDNGKFIPIEFSGENSTAIGFINAGYFEEHDYNDAFISGKITNILNDMALESPNSVYDTPDGKKFYMGYYKNSVQGC